MGILQQSKRLYKALGSAVDEEGRVFSLDKECKISFMFQGQETVLGHILVGENHLIYHKFDDERNIFRKTESWSVNYTIFKQVDYIIYETTRFYYRIPKVRAEEFGEVLHFTTTEKKIYIPIKYWEKRPKTVEFGPNLRGVSATEERRRNLLGDSWYEKLSTVINSPFMAEIGNFIRSRRKVAKVYPDEANVFKAFKLCSFEHTKVVILGQDPYNDGSASGLAFGYLDNSKCKVAKSLDIICNEVEADLYNGFRLDVDYTLEEWAEQGVLLLNSVLTVEHGKPNSHAKTKTSPGIGWERFTKIVLYELLKDIQPKVFMVWGNAAKDLLTEVTAKVDTGLVSNHKLLYAKHPAADLYGADSFGNIHPNYPSTFRGCKHFSQANEFLISKSKKPIKW